MRGNLHQLGVDSLAVLRRFAPLALSVAVGAAALFAFVLDLSLPFTLVLALGVYVGVALLLSKPAVIPNVIEEPLSPDEETFVRARDETAQVLHLAQQIENESMRARVVSIGQTFDRMLDVMQEDKNYMLAPDYEANLVEPFEKKLSYYVRLTKRGIDLANPQLLRFEQVDVPRNETLARTFYQRYHDLDVMDLAALLETFWDNPDDDVEEQEFDFDDEDDAETRL
jgi:hypothetical protein